ncbi:ATP-dependent DNA helicase PIF1-like protein [Tanacetum coccineum]
MITRLAYEAFDRTLRDICTSTYTTNSDKVFGGKVVVFGGDFQQILPVIPNSSRQDIVHASLNMSYLWQHCTVLKLTKNMRLRVGCNPEDAEEINDFADWILNIEEGKIGGKNDGHAPVEFPEEMLIPDSNDHIESLIAETYDNWQHNLWDPTYFQERAILAPTHEQVDKVNERMLAKLPSRERVFYSSDSVSDVDIDFNFNESLYTTEFLNTIKMSSIPHHKLVLKIGSPVMCMQNIDQRGGLCNGTRLQVLRMRKINIECKIISGGKVGTVVAIPRMNISCSQAACAEAGSLITSLTSERDRISSEGILGHALGRTIDFGMMEGLEARYEHGVAGTQLSAIEAYNPKAARTSYLDAVRALEDVDFPLLTSQKLLTCNCVLSSFPSPSIILMIRPSLNVHSRAEGAKKHAAALRQLMMEIVSNPLSSQTWVGETSTSAAPLSVEDFDEVDTDEALGSVVAIPKFEACRF